MTLAQRLLDPWRRRVLDWALYVIVGLGALMLVPTFVMFARRGRLTFEIGFYTLTLVGFGALALLPRIEFRLRGTLFLALLFGCGAFAFKAHGYFSDARLLLFTVTGLAALLFGLKGAAIVLVLSALLVGAGIGGLIEIPIGPTEELHHKATLATMLASFVFMSGAFSVPLAVLLKRVERGAEETQELLNRERLMIQREREALEALDRERDKVRRELEQRVGERTRELSLANRELEAFSYSVSHDLRAPLRHIAGYVEILQGKLGSGVQPDIARCLCVIADATERMGSLIDDLLRFARIARSSVNFRSVELEPLVREVINELESETAGRSVVWSVSNLPAVCGDRALLKHVLLNLFSNAVKYTSGRPVARIEVGSLPAAPEGDERVLYVRDNGAGFDPRYAAKLFRVFQRLHNASEFEGNGVGLALVQRIVERHGGSVRAEGSVGSGASFYVSLPAARAT